MLKSHEISRNTSYFSQTNYHEKIKPIKRVYNAILVNTPKRRSKFIIEGIKHFSKLSASGTTTLNSLQYIKRSQSLKHVSKFEYDPFLCDLSCLKTLCKVLHKLKHIKSLNLSIRRVDSKDEPIILGPFIYKLLKMKKLKVELPNTQNIDERGIVSFGETFGKCLSVKYLEYAFINLPPISEQSNDIFYRAHQKLVQLEELITAVSYSKAVVGSDIKRTTMSNPFRKSKLQKLSMGVRINTGWTSMGGNIAPEQFFKSLSLATFLKELTFKTHGLTLNTEVNISIFDILAQMSFLKSLHIEHFNCNAGDTEILGIAYGLTKLPQLERFTFKNIQHPNVSGSCILPLAKTISRLSNLKNVDIYLRRLSIPEETAEELVSQLSLIENIQMISLQTSTYLTKLRSDSQTSLNSPTFPQSSFKEKIKPITRVHHTILGNFPKRRSKFVAEGITNFSKLTATGESTLNSLQNIIKSKSLKWVSKFEFDAFLCDFSYIKELCKALHKLKDIKELTLVIRRLDKKNESTLLSPYIYKLLKLKKLRVELPNTQKIDNQGVKDLRGAFAKCFSLKSLTYTFIDLPTLTERNDRGLLTAHKKLAKLEELSTKIFYAKTGLSNSFERDSCLTSFRNYKLQKYCIDVKVNSGWTSLQEDSTAGEFFKRMAIAGNMRELIFRINGCRQSTQGSLEMFDGLAFMKNLRSLTFEIAKSDIADTEVMTLAYGLTKIPQIEQFTFKNIQFPNVSGSCLIPLATIISKLNNLKKVDIYFRRLDIPEEMAEKLVCQLSRIENIQVSYFKGSLHLYRYSSL